MNATPFYPDVNAHVASGMSTFARPSSLYSAAATSTPSPSSAPTTARGSQEAVGSEFGPPPSILPPSSQRMIPGSGSQGYYYFELSLLFIFIFYDFIVFGIQRSAHDWSTCAAAVAAHYQTDWCCYSGVGAAHRHRLRPQRSTGIGGVTLGALGSAKLAAARGESDQPFTAASAPQ